MKKCIRTYALTYVRTDFGWTETFRKIILSKPQDSLFERE